jgi:hypothetical protein
MTRVTWLFESSPGHAHAPGRSSSGFAHMVDRRHQQRWRGFPEALPATPAEA